MIGFVVGMLIGASFGIVLMAIANIARKNDRE